MLRRRLLDENQLEAVVSLPAGCFRPYTGVSTAILVFTKGGRTDRVFFGDVQSDGYSLDDKREKLGPADDFGDLGRCIAEWRAWTANRDPSAFAERSRLGFVIAADEIRSRGHDLSITQYKSVSFRDREDDPPERILDDLRKLEAEAMTLRQHMESWR